MLDVRLSFVVTAVFVTVLCPRQDAHANPVGDGECCFAHAYYKPNATPPGGCLKQTTCSDIQQKGLFVRCYHKTKNGDLRVNGKRPANKYSHQSLMVGGKPVEFDGMNYPNTPDTYNWTASAEIIEGPKSRLKVRPIKAYCSGAMAKQRPSVHKTNPITYQFRLGAFLRDFTGRVLERFEQGRLVRERETRLWDLPLAKGELVIKR